MSTPLLMTDEIVWSYIVEPVCPMDETLNVESVVADCSGKFPKLTVTFADGVVYHCERCKPRYKNTWMVTEVYPS